MNKQQFAELLTGREYSSEISRDEESIAKRNGLVVVFGYSDDSVEFRGAIDDEVGAYDGTTVLIHDGKVLQRHDCDCKYCGYKILEKSAKKIEAKWCCDPDSPAWTFKTDIPHATFDIVEDGEQPFCRGIVFDYADVVTVGADFCGEFQPRVQEERQAT